MFIHEAVEVEEGHIDLIAVVLGVLSVRKEDHCQIIDIIVLLNVCLHFLEDIDEVSCGAGLHFRDGCLE